MLDLLSEISAGATVGIIIAVVVGAIVLMVLLNKLLDYLSNRFYVGYQVFLFLVSGAVFGTSFIADKTTRIGMYIISNFLYFYFLFTDIGAERWTTTESTTHVDHGIFSDNVTVEEKEVEHDRPAWWVKLIMVLVSTAIASALGLWAQIAWLPFVAEEAFCLFLIISYFVHRRRARNRRR